MNEIWANRLIAGTKTWEQVPASRREGVAAVLAERVEVGELSDERRREIVGEQ